MQRTLALAAVLLAAALAAAGCANFAAIAPDGSAVYWAAVSSVHASPVDGSPGRTRDLGAPWLNTAALDPDGRHGYVVQESALKRLRTSDFATDGTASLGSLLPVFAAAAPGALYLAERGGSAVRVATPSLRVGTAKALAHLGGGSATDSRGAVTPDGRWVLFATNGAGATLDRIDTASFAGTGPLVERALALGDNGGASLALSPDGATAYVSSWGRVTAIDVARMAVARTLPVLGDTVQLVGIATSTRHPRLYGVTGEIPNARLVAIDTDRMAVLGIETVDVSGSDAWLTITPDGTTVVIGDQSGIRQRVVVADPPNTFTSTPPQRFGAGAAVAIEVWARPSTASGELRLAITTRAGAVACSATATVTSLRPRRLRCVLSPAVRAQLARGTLRLRATTTFAPPGYAAASRVWQLRLARAPLPPAPAPVTG